MPCDSRDTATNLKFLTTKTEIINQEMSNKFHKQTSTRHMHRHVLFFGIKANAGSISMPLLLKLAPKLLSDSAIISRLHQKIQI
jgi:hypothetical protein